MRFVTTYGLALSLLLTGCDSAPAVLTEPPEAGSVIEGVPRLTAAAHLALPALVRIDVLQRSRVRSLTEEERLQIPFPFLMADSIRTRPEARSGSGFIYDGAGLVMTNRHVIAGADRVIVRLQDGREYEAVALGTDAGSDVAVLRITAPDSTRFPTIPLGDSDSVEVGDWVLALGSPLELDFSVTAGIVSAKGRTIGILAGESAAPQEVFLQTDAAINSGNSGGPLVDEDGRVVGINSAIQSPTGVFAGYGFAVPINLARKVARDIVEGGVVRRAKLGALVSDVRAADAIAFGLPSVQGAVVRSVERSGPAESAGVQPGDVLLAVGPRTIEHASDFTLAIAEYLPGDEVTVAVFRDGARHEMTVQLGTLGTEADDSFTSAPRPPTQQEMIGFVVETLEPRWARTLGVAAGTPGVLIVGVDPYSPAAAAGITPGILLLEMNGERIATVGDYERAARDLGNGDLVSLIVRIAPETDVILNYLIRV